MWLLDTTTLKLHNFMNDYERPHYAILSHTWGEEEVSFQEIQGSHDDMMQKAGYEKIQRCCAQAASDGFPYVWIDTCCIDKTNSVELSEAINSMYRWYREALECYAYLADVHSFEPIYDPESGQCFAEFEESRWFTRGWTLQELLAPSTVLFFNTGWVELGTRASLHSEISKCTGIPSAVLLSSSKSIESFSLAQRMSWAAGRETAREEDIAYSLLGIFDVSMPLLYGEGKKAFIRLQLEIMRTSADHSIFAWTRRPSPDDGGQRSGPLATSPSDFKLPFGEGATRHRVADNFAGLLEANQGVSSFAMTNRGLRIELPMVSIEDTGEVGAIMNFRVEKAEEEDGFKFFGIYLWKASDGTYTRSRPWTLFMTDSIVGSITYTTLYITEPPLVENSLKSRPGRVPFLITHNTESGQEFVLTEKLSLYSGDYGDHFEQDIMLHWTIEEGSGAAALLFRRPATAQEFAVLFGIYDDESLWSEILIWRDPDLTLEEELISRYPPKPREGFGRGAGKVYDRAVVQIAGGFGPREQMKLIIRKVMISSRPGYNVEISVFTEQESVDTNMTDKR
tara:strand:- start:924 stop:2621 length:1698 start_codon:yes stop_codon:yes gene_type:complete